MILSSWSARGPRLDAISRNRLQSGEVPKRAADLRKPLIALIT